MKNEAEAIQSAHDDFRKRQAKKDNEQKKPSKILDQWYELHGDIHGKKGRKLIMFSRTEMGVSRVFIDYEIRVAGIIADLKKEGKLRAASL